MEFNPPPQTRYGHCDSYFVVSDDEEFNVVAERKREQTRSVARAHQRQLGLELSKITADEYQEDILDHMEFMESETVPDVNSIDIQTEVQWYMRPYLLDFLIEAHAAFQLLPETLFLTINLLDRYCSRRVVYKRHYQLVGCAALLIASKYGDKKERVPTVRELRSMCCALYDEEMFIQMEWHVLQTLNWVIGHPTIDSFLQIALEEDGHADIEAQHMTWYICELALFHKEFVSVRPSVLARSALALSRCILGRQHTQQTDWSNRYDATVILNLANYLSSPSQVLARKYGSNQLSSVASTVAYFVQQQNQKTAIVAEPTRPIVDDHSPPIGNPQTPQKPPYGAAVMTNGCLTPPITPENDQSFQNGFAKSAIPPLPPRFPPTPSPIPRVEPPMVPSPYEHPNAYHPYMRPHFVQ